MTVSTITLNGRLTEDPREAMRKTVNGDAKVIELRIAANPYIGGKNT